MADRGNGAEERNDTARAVRNFLRSVRGLTARQIEEIGELIRASRRAVRSCRGSAGPPLDPVSQAIVDVIPMSDYSVDKVIGRVAASLRELSKIDVTAPIRALLPEKAVLQAEEARVPAPTEKKKANTKKQRRKRRAPSGRRKKR